MRSRPVIWGWGGGGRPSGGMVCSASSTRRWRRSSTICSVGGEIAQLPGERVGHQGIVEAAAGSHHWRHAMEGESGEVGYSYPCFGLLLCLQRSKNALRRDCRV